MDKPAEQVHVFLIHAHSDKSAVLKLHQRLIRDGVDAWLDTANLQPGQDWQGAIRRAILKSDAVVVCLSRSFNRQHGFRHEELKLALEKASLLVDEVFLIPAGLERCETPEALRHLHRVDLYANGGYKKLLHALRGEAGLSP